MKKGKYGIYNKYIKRIFDIVISLVSLVVLSPLFIVLIVAGAIAMNGNPFFIQERPGMINPKTGKEKIFKIIKFRTMSNATDKNNNLLADENRLSRYGKFLRASSLDELGELINILKGDMSVVGPRPLLVQYLERYTDEQRHRHDVRPGLTGYAQAHGRNLVSWEDKFAMDIWYTENISFLCDVKIVFDTFFSVIKHEGIRSETSATMEEFKGRNEREVSK